MEKHGYFVVSLDFELLWGMFDKVSLEEYGENIKNVHAVVPEILNLFEKFGIHATWATVGMLMYDNKVQLRGVFPQENLQPKYADENISSYRHVETLDNIEGRNDPYHFGPSLVRKIIETPGQELASHTFSHYYCIDGSENNQEIFSADCEAMQKAASRFGVRLTSIVFPRNQTTESALKTCTEHGLTVYRGTENHFLYKPRSDNDQTNLFIRGLRFIDSYVNISGHQTYTISISDTENDGGLVNIKSSRFLRPYMPMLSFLEGLRLRRIKKSMTRAAKRGEIFHLWWHPHNFGANQNENLLFLESILSHYSFLKETYSMESKSMREVASVPSSG